MDHCLSCDRPIEPFQAITSFGKVPGVRGFRLLVHEDCNFVNPEGLRDLAVTVLEGAVNELIARDGKKPDPWTVSFLNPVLRQECNIDLWTDILDMTPDFIYEKLFNRRRETPK